MEKERNSNYGYVEGFDIYEDMADRYPNTCCVSLRDGDGNGVGPCWHALGDGVCPSHGQVKLKEDQTGVMTKGASQFFLRMFLKLKGK